MWENKLGSNTNYFLGGGGGGDLLQQLDTKMYLFIYFKHKYSNCAFYLLYVANVVDRLN